MPPKEGLTLIDGEYCDINFDESEFIPENIEPINTTDLGIDHYVDTDDIENENHPNIIKKNGSDSVDIIMPP